VRQARRIVAAVLVVIGFQTFAGTQAKAPTQSRSVFLARVELAGSPETYPLPVHALLQDSAGRDYLIVFAGKQQLDRAAWPWRALAANCAPEECVLATELRPNARQTAGLVWNPFLDDGRRWLLKANAEQVQALSELGFAVQRMDSEPITWPQAPRLGRDGGTNRTSPLPLVADMMGSVQTTNLYSLLACLSGQESVLAGGGPYLVRTRHTSSGIVLTNGLEAAYNRLQALGLAPFFYLWSSGSYTNRNIVANLPGTLRSNEVVLVTAHLDDMPSGTTAPGADDNASGCAGVLTAAGVCAQYEFERTIRFVLFTGEEQGLLGSARYAAAVQAAGENVAAVLNLDMVGWDGTPPPKFQLHTRTTASAGYSNDMAIASTFTNVVSAYGLSSMLTNVVLADGITASDHSSFWNRGYPAVLAIEDYGGDFNPYYHTTGDTLQRMNLAYFTAAVKASLGTVAHLAGPVSRRPGVDVVEVAPSDWNPISGIRAHAFVARHLAGATEREPDPLDTLGEPSDPLTPSLRLGSYPYGLELWTDSRPCDSESGFSAVLELVSTGPVTFDNKLRVEFLTPPGADRIYLARVHTYLPEPSGFLCVTNIRDLAVCGHYVALPGLTNSYSSRLGSCEITCRFLDKSAAGCPLRLVSADDSSVSLSTSAQVGVTIVDQVEYTTNLAAGAWTRTATYTNQITPDPENFDSGWVELVRTVDVSGFPPSAGHYFRLNRTWLTP
jgi:hypothetical protein